MEENLTQKSIRLALSANWKEAIKTNLLILHDDPTDIECLNRLAKAYFENGEVNKAKRTSQSVLKIDKLNNIAKNALEKYKQRQPSNSAQTKIGHTSFIEEIGKTKLTKLINLGSEKIYSCLNSGEEIFIFPHAHKVSVTTVDNKYIGKLTDDLSARLRKLLKAGYKYKLFVKLSSKNDVKVFIREVKRGQGYHNVPSFPKEASESFGEFSS